MAYSQDGEDYKEQPNSLHQELFGEEDEKETFEENTDDEEEIQI